MVIVLLSLGFILIIKGGDWFLSAAVWMSEKTGIPKMIIGATVVSFATTLPEVLVTLLAVGQGSYDLGIGNAIGSVMANTGLILTLSLIFLPIVVNKKIFAVQAGIMLLALIWLFVVLQDATLSIVESLPLLVLGGVYIAYNINCAKRQLIPASDDTPAHGGSTLKNIFLFILGAGCLIGGARLLVDNGVALALYLGVTESIVGVTVVAIGTSLPELVCTITAIIKKETSMGVGNIIGANTINLTILMSASSLLSGGQLKVANELFKGQLIPRVPIVDIPIILIIFAIFLLPTLLNKGRTSRFQGFAMLLCYLFFMWLIFS